MIIIHATSVDLETISMFCSFAISVIFTAAMSTAILSFKIKFHKETGFASIAEASTKTTRKSNKMKNSKSQIDSNSSLLTSMWLIVHGQDRTTIASGTVFQYFVIFVEQDDTFILIFTNQLYEDFIKLKKD